LVVEKVSVEKWIPCVDGKYYHVGMSWDSVLKELCFILN